jgi:hypothetical protein
VSDWLRKVTSGRVALVATVIFFAFTALVLPGQSTSTATETGEVGAPDTAFFYTPADLYRFAEAYGEEGRAAYIRARFTFDIAWPIVYTLFLATAITWLYARAFSSDSRWQLANLAPLIGAILDYLENVSTSLVMWRYPARTPVVDTLAPVFSLAKWAFVGGSFVLLLFGLAMAVRRWRRDKG